MKPESAHSPELLWLAFTLWVRPLHGLRMQSSKAIVVVQTLRMLQIARACRKATSCSS